MSITYINTDLDLVASFDLAPLASAFEGRGLFALNVLDLGNGSWRANFETEVQFEEPEANIAALLLAIESLDSMAVEAWRACTVREFSIGYEFGAGLFLAKPDEECCAVCRASLEGSARNFYPISRSYSVCVPIQNNWKRSGPSMATAR